MCVCVHLGLRDTFCDVALHLWPRLRSPLDGWGSGYLAFCPKQGGQVLVTDAGHDTVHVLDAESGQHMGAWIIECVFMCGCVWVCVARAGLLGWLHPTRTSSKSPTPVACISLSHRGTGTGRWGGVGLRGASIPLSV